MHPPMLSFLPTGTDAMDIAIGPPVGDSGDSRPVAGSIDGLTVDSEVDELDEPDAELGALGCTQAANSKTRTAITTPNGTILGDFNVAARAGGYRDPRELSKARSSSSMARQDGKRDQSLRYQRATESSAAAAHPLHHRAAPWS